VFREKRKSKGSEHLLSLIYAIKNRLITTFFYLKYDNTVSHVRKVEPYALKEFKGRWYLLAPEIDGKLEERGMIKTWGLDRIKNLNITPKGFNKNSRINIEDEFKNSFGIFSDKDKKVEEVILSFTPMGGKYNESFPLHESQETLIDNDEEFRIKLKVKLTYDFIMELLSQSEKMKVIAPVHLRDALIDIHKRAIETLQHFDSE
jgi:predicted DNA-binding transcriptional regulator YafY